MTMIVSIAYINFGNLFKDFKEDADREALVKDWYRIFKDYDYRVVQIALDYLINNVKIENIQLFNQADLKSEIKSKIVKLTTQEQLSEIEAINMIKKAVSRSGWYSVEEFEKLPPILQKLVDTPSRLKQWSQMGSEFDTVVLSQLRKGYDIMLKREQERVALPMDVKQALENNSIKIGKGFIKLRG